MTYCELKWEIPIDIVGVISGALRFPIWKFLLAAFLGKTLLIILLIQTGAWGWDALLRYIGSTVLKTGLLGTISC